jgi:ABC-type proline/glycine betaine transport system substrate-binding protein
MKTLVSLAVALGLMAGAAVPAFAADAPKTKAECEKAHMKWDATTKKCS